MKLVKPLDLFHSIVKDGSRRKGRLLGLDVGKVYVGLAVSDSMCRITSPLSVLVRNKTNVDIMAKDFETLVSELSLGGLIVGLPYGFRGSINAEAVQVRCFINDLCRTGKLKNLSYTYWDESFTSKCVEALLSPLKLHPVESKTILDKFAAVGILQGYLDCMHRELKKQTDVQE